MRSNSDTWRLDGDMTAIMAAATRLGQIVHIRSGGVIYRQGDQDPYFYLVVLGQVQVFMVRDDGAEFIFEFMGRNTVFGEGPAFDGEPRYASAMATEASTLIRFDANRLRQSDDAAFAWALMRVCSVKQRVLAVRIQQMTSPEPERRILEVIGRVQEVLGAASHGGVNLTHDQIASMTGTSRVTVTRALKRLREEGRIQHLKTGLKICDTVYQGTS